MSRLALFFILIIAVGALFFADYKLGNSNPKYFYLCLEGSAEELQHAMDVGNWDANEIFTVKLKSGDYKYPVLLDYYVGREPGKSEKFTPLYLASGNNDPNVLKLLLKRGARLTQNVLDSALERRMTNNVRVLIDEMKNKKMRIQYSFPQYWHPNAPVTFFVTKKIEGEIQKILQDLIDLGAFSHETDEMVVDAARRVTDVNFYLILEQNGIDIQKKATRFLEQAAVAGRLETTKLFLERGGNPNARPSSVPLLIKAATGNGGADVLAALLRAGADPNVRDMGMTTLMHLDKQIAQMQAELTELRAKAKSDTTWRQGRIEEFEHRRAVLVEAGATL